MITRFKDWNWDGVPVRAYKANPAGADGVTRQTLSEGVNGDFELRYFEVEPGGYTSHEIHQHEHLVVAVRGCGTVLLGTEWHEVGTFDVVHVPSHTPHQFRCKGTEPFGILCVVDRVRDRPTHIGDGAEPLGASDIR